MNAYETALALTVMARAGEDGTVDSFASFTEYATGAQDTLPTTGYWVGGVKKSLIVNDVSELDRGELGWFIGEDINQYYGVWTDVEDGKIYFDAVTHVEDAAAALNLAFSRDEIAVWDIANGTEIRVKNAQGAGDDK